MRFKTRLTGIAATTLALVALISFPAAPASATVPVQALASGVNSEVTVPPLPTGTTYIEAVLTGVTPLFLRSDGTIVVSGTPACGTFSIPPLEGGLKYVSVSAGQLPVIAAVRSDGNLSLIGCGGAAVPDAPPALPLGVTYTKVSLRGDVVAALRSDGRVAIFTLFRTQDTYAPISTVTAEAGYTAAVSGADYVLLLGSDGRAKVFDASECCGQPVVPKLPAGVRFTALDGLGGISAFVRSDGKVAVRARTGIKKPPVPDLPRGLKYVGVAIGGSDYLLLLRSDGQAVAAGFDRGGLGYLDIPVLPKGSQFFGIAAGSSRSVFLTKSIMPGTTLPTSITKITHVSVVPRGKGANIRVKVFSMASTKGGKVKITYRGKTIGTGVVGSGAVAKVKISTSALPRDARNKIGIAFMGKGQAAKSTSATKVTSIIRTR